VVCIGHLRACLALVVVVNAVFLNGHYSECEWGGRRVREAVTRRGAAARIHAQRLIGVAMVVWLSGWLCGTKNKMEYLLKSY
jgi:hypothetical protein